MKPGLNVGHLPKAETLVCRRAQDSRINDPLFQGHIIRQQILKSMKWPAWIASTTFPGIGGRAEESTKGAVLDGPKLTRGVANNDAKEGGALVEVRLLSAMGGGGSIAGEETGIPVPPPPVEKTGAKLRKESSDGDK